MSLELSAEFVANHQVSYVLKSHGITVSVDTLKIGKGVQDLPIMEQIVTILTFLNTATPCLGFELSKKQNLVALKPHQIGVLQSTKESQDGKTLAFSLSCQLITSAGSVRVLELSIFKETNQSKLGQKENNKEAVLLKKIATKDTFPREK